MEAPIVRAWKNSSWYTKGTYYSMVFNLILIFWGYRSLSRSSASIWVTCHAVECTLQITPPNGLGTTTLNFSRKQLVKSQAIKVDKLNNFVRVDSGQLNHNYSAKARKTQKKNRAGPDIDGNYDSYTMHLRPPIQNDDPDDESAKYEIDLAKIEQFTSRDEGTENRVLAMRQFNIGQTKRRSKTMTNKLDAYIQQRRHQLVIKENSSLGWQGVVALVFGIFFIMLTCLAGQFVDEPKTGGPGTRRPVQQKKKLKKTKPIPGKYN